MFEPQRQGVSLGVEVNPINYFRGQFNQFPEFQLPPPLPPPLFPPITSSF
jgi:hypothetical protein